ncbi:MAG: HAMP domain-containing sensor histidine kinase [Bacteroidia bacterium]|nr:HAMP domain-containing sensor histidine kinase [Bacteroidia bacterium]
MKLQNKINIRFLLVTLLVFTVAGVIFYFALDRVIDHNIKGILKSRKTNIILYLQHNKTDSILLGSPDRTIFIRQIAKTEDHSFISDTLAYDEREKELIPFRKMVFSTSVDNNYFEVTILQSLLESEDLQGIIFYFMAILFSLIFLALFFLNRWLSDKAWRPFFKSLSLLKSWKISENRQISFDQTGISEFDQLNRTLEEMIQKMQTDFVNLKEFTENASHEIQTPLAIIKSKLELLLNDNELSGLQHKQLHDAFESVIRMSKLNEALLLLSKIENRQFIEKCDIDFCMLIHSRLEYLEELFALKQIEISVQLNVPVIISIHPMLADILINNLLNNTLKHNFNHGKIIISSGINEITFSNTGKPLTIDPSKLFRRFVKNNNSEESTGLGLAIADEICRANHLRLNYTYLNDLHSFILSC